MLVAPARFVPMVAVFALLATAPLCAQPANVATWQGGNPTAVFVNNPGYADPYATVGVPAPWFGGGQIMPLGTTVRGRLWGRLEYLRWWTDGMDLPPLVTTSPNTAPQNQAGVLGQPDTGILFGSGEINSGGTNGLRARGGYWFTPGGNFAIESEYFGLERQDDNFAAASDGTTVLARPYFDLLAGDEASQLVAYPGLASGSLQVLSETRLKSFLINGRVALCPGAPCNFDGQSNRVDWIVGYRFLELKDRLTFGVTRDGLIATEPDRVVVNEQFATRNRFGGLQLGVTHLANFRRAWLESMLRVAIGSNRQKVSISGGSSITDAGTTSNFTGGLLAQRTNIGNFERSQFAMIPEIGLTLGFRFNDAFQATLGYSVLYYPNVVRAADLIDRDINPNLIPPETVPFAGPLRPEFRFVESDYWAHGVNIGGELRF
jgi:hypothetical protein